MTVYLKVGELVWLVGNRIGYSDKLAQDSAELFTVRMV